MEDKLKYFIYCRKSEEDEKRQILSIEAQLRELKDYARKCNLHVIEILTESKSARKPGREIFNAMLNRIESGEANAMLVWQVNRLARNHKDGGNILQFITDGVIKQVDTPNKQFKNTGDDKFVMSIEFGMATKYSDDLSDNIKRGNRQKYERGEYIGWAPIGYRNEKVNGNPNIVIAQENAQMVKRAFEEYATGNYSLGTMCNAIASWGLKTQKGKVIGKSHLQSVLSNPTYYGSFRHSGELHKGNYEPLISKSLFDNVQDVLHNRSKPKKQHFDWTYAGLLKCGCDCGASVVFETKKKYYKGTDRHAEYTYVRSSKRCGPCLEKGTTLGDLENEIADKVDRVTLSEAKWKLGLELLQLKYQDESNKRSEIVENLQRARTKSKNELDGYFKMRAQEEMTKEDFKEKKDKLMNDMSNYEEKINEAMHNQKHWLELAVDFMNTAFQAKEIILGDNLEEKRKIIKKIGWNLKLKEGKLVWTYQMPYDVLLIPEYRSDMSTRWDDFRTLDWDDLVEYPQIYYQESQQFLKTAYPTS